MAILCERRNSVDKVLKGVWNMMAEREWKRSQKGFEEDYMKYINMGLVKPDKSFLKEDRQNRESL